MNPELSTLIITAASIGLFHTLLGPDHYLPFVALAKDRNWSMLKTILITTLCGIGHVIGSVLLGLLGVSFGLAITNVESFESFRGNLAGWALTSFGLIYLAYGLRQLYKKKSHSHLLGGKHKHPTKKNLTSIWVMFIIFVLGPCEPLIPILMYPAAKGGYTDMIIVASIFALVTISTMIVVVGLLLSGIKNVKFSKLEKYSHAMAGFTILLCGLAIQFGL